jgi:hypothetical protein
VRIVMTTDPIKSKYYTGTFANGQGPILGQTVSGEAEFKGVHGAEGKSDTNKVSSDGGTDVKPHGEDKQFDLHGKTYAGPENWQPENHGVANPDDVKSS